MEWAEAFVVDTRLLQVYIIRYYVYNRLTVDFVNAFFFNHSFAYLRPQK